MSARKPVAIVGIAAHLPSGEYSSVDLDYHAFWDFLMNRGVSGEPLSVAGIGSKKYIVLPKLGSFFKDTERFDYVSFGISGTDARSMSPAHRRLIELSFEALLDSGIDYRGRKIGCYMSGNDDRDTEEMYETDGSIAGIPSAMAARVSYTFNLTGPSFTVDSACSSSLTALHLAASAIEAGECTAALVGACQSNRSIAEWEQYVQAKVLSPDGSSKVFDAGADGFARGEGAVVIVLKGESEAIRDGDRIYGVILGSAINSTGSASPLHAPDGDTQAQCILAAYDKAGVLLSDADYVELHATGTSVGDPIEVTACGKLFNNYDNKNLPIGSVKSNIGHLECCAFLASLVKCCLILAHGTIPPVARLSVRNPAIDWDDFNLYVPEEAQALGCRSRSGRSIVSISSAGIGGSTGHVVLTEVSHSASAAETPSSRSHLFLFGGFSDGAIETMAESAASHCETNPEDATLTAALLSRRVRQFPLRAYKIHPPLSGIISPPPTRAPSERPSIVFVFSGQGPHHLEMGRNLFAHYPIFRRTILELDDVHRQVCGQSLIEMTGLFTDLPVQPKLQLPKHGWPVSITCPALAMLHIALYDLINTLGIRADYFVGHSAGETALVYASGAGPKALALEIAIARGRAMTATEAAGAGMAALLCSAQKAEDIIARVLTDKRACDGHLSIACYNAPNSVTLSGANDLLDRAVEVARAESIVAQRIRTFVPGHSAYMHLCEKSHKELMEGVFSRYKDQISPPRTPIFSTCTNHSQVVEFNADYFWRNCRNPVTFSTAIDGVVELRKNAAGATIFLEISPHPVLSSSIVAHGIDQTHVLCPMRRSTSATDVGEVGRLLDTLGRLSMLGVNDIDLSKDHALSGPLSLPWLKYPFVLRTVPSRLTRSKAEAFLSSGSPESMPISHHPRTIFKDLTQHKVFGDSILPATGYIELLLQLGATYVWDMDILQALPLPDDGRVHIEIERSETQWSISTTASDANRRFHARGRMDSLKNDTPAKVDIKAWAEGLPTVDVSELYEDFTSAVTFGPLFRRVVKCRGRPDKIAIEVAPIGQEEASETYIIHPAMLDACLHPVLLPFLIQNRESNAFFLPSHVRSFAFHSTPSRQANILSLISLVDWSPGTRMYDVLVVDSTTGTPVCTFSGLTLQRHWNGHPDRAPAHFDIIYQPVAADYVLPGIPRHFQSYNRDCYEVLDQLATQIMAGQRYAGAMSQLDAKKHHHDDEVIVDLRARLPAHMEITERLRKARTYLATTSEAATSAHLPSDLMDRFAEERLNESILTVVKDAFDSLTSAVYSGGKKCLRVLEVRGASPLMRYLSRDPDRLTAEGSIVEHTISDVSRIRALGSTSNQSSACTSTHTTAFDTSILLPGSYDVIIAHEVLHGTLDIQSNLAQLHALLVPGGTMVTVELDGAAWKLNIPGSTWYNWAFSTLAEASGYKDTETRSLMTPSEWDACLRKAGFAPAALSTGASGGIDMLIIAQRPLCDPLLLSALVSQPSRTVTFPYRLGTEPQLQKMLANMDANERYSLILVAGVGPDADAASGFIHSLYSEYEGWDVHLIVYEDLGMREQIPPAKACLESEIITLVRRSGQIDVPRLVPIPPLEIIPSDDRSLKLEDGCVHLQILQRADCSPFSTFVGCVSQTWSPDVPCDSLVLGISVSKHHGQHVTIPASEVIVLPDNQCVAHHNLFAAITIALLSGSAWIESNRSARPPSSVLLALSNEELGVDIEECLSAKRLLHSFSIAPSELGSQTMVDIIVTDTAKLLQSPRLSRRLARSGRLIVWDAQLRSLIQDDQFGLRDLLHNAHDLLLSTLPLSTLPARDTLSAAPPQFPRDSVTSSQSTNIFRSDCSYILVGGLSSLGVELSLWMVEHGAHYIVLTSRRGTAAMEDWDSVSRMKLVYLVSRPHTTIRLEKCDATRDDDTMALLSGLQLPVGGCIFIALVLAESLFRDQDARNFAIARQPKQVAFDVFFRHADIKSLDFVIHISSISSMFVGVGLSPYASACSELDATLGQHKNAFSLICPAILDVGYVSRLSSEMRKHLEGWAIPVNGLCRCLEDGILKLRSGAKFARYIPEVSWDYPPPVVTTQRNSPYLRHFLRARKTQDVHPPLPEAQTKDPMPTLLALLGITASDFSLSRPLVDFGLDSIGASRVASALQAFGIRTTQIQILSGATWADLSKQGSHRRVGAPAATEMDIDTILDIIARHIGVRLGDLDASKPLLSYGIDPSTSVELMQDLHQHVRVSQEELFGNEPLQAVLARKTVPVEAHPDSSIYDDVLIELVSGSGVPVVILHGATGSVHSLLALRPFFKSPLWALQAVKGEHNATMESLAEFYFRCIAYKFPSGALRLAAYSASCILGVAVAKHFEDSHRTEDLLGLTFIDHFPPALYALASLVEPDKPDSLAASVHSGLASLTDMMQRDPRPVTAGYTSDAIVVKELNDALNGLAVSGFTDEILYWLKQMVEVNFRFLQDLGGSGGREAVLARLTEWMATLGTPLVLIIATRGLGASFPAYIREEWLSLGAEHARQPVTIRRIDAGHFGLLRQPVTAELLRGEGL